MKDFEGILRVLDVSDQTSTEKILEEEEKILQNVVETRGKEGRFRCNRILRLIV